MLLTPSEKQTRNRQQHMKGGDRERQHLVVSPACQSSHGAPGPVSWSETLAALAERLAQEEVARVTASMDSDQYRVSVGDRWLRM